MKILELSATELAKKIKAGEITSEEAAKASLAQIAKEDQKIRAYLTVDEEKVLARRIRQNWTQSCRNFTQSWALGRPRSTSQNTQARWQVSRSQ